MAILSNDKTYVTVVKGDTLSEIAVDYKAYSNNATYKQLAAINNIPNPDLIYIGQKVKLVKSGSSSTSTSQTMATVTNFGHQSNSDGTLFATWSWSRSHTQNYEVEWCYDTGDGVWFVGNKSTTEDKQSTYSIPTNAKKVRFRVKPISKKYTSNNKETSYWTASWSTAKTYNTSSLPPETPSVPTVTIKKNKLTAKIENIDATAVRATGVQFQIVKDDTTLYKTAKATINTKTNVVSYSLNVAAGAEYKVRARSYKGSDYSDWTQYSSNVESTPSSPAAIETIKATSATSIYLEWTSVKAAKSYDIEYATKKEYFDRTDKATQITGVEFTYRELIGLESGEEYFFRVRAVGKDNEPSSWCEMASVVIGKEPTAPTTWSSTTTATTGEELTLYWVHNSEDNSSQTYAELELIINGVKETITIQNTTDEDIKDLTSSYSFDTSIYVEGTSVQWRVRTAGITKVYGDWSIQRIVDIYAPPTLELTVKDSNEVDLEILNTFPFHIYALAGPNTQVPTGYTLTITANDGYETVDTVGNPVTVNKGDYVYSKYFDISDPLSIDISAGDVDLENNITYTIHCIVSMNSGLTAEAMVEFTVVWVDDEYSPNAEINLDTDTLVTHIRPYCNKQRLAIYKVNRVNYKKYELTDEEIESVCGDKVTGVVTTTGEDVFYGTTDEGENVYYAEVILSDPITDVLLALYRREFDGSFVELATDIDGGSNTFVTDPHPALDYARYRVVAISKSTGAVSYYDIPGYPVGGTSIILQWDEAWSNFDITTEDELEQPPWSGSLLKLPYNIDVSDNSNPDVELIDYIGRSHPVSYYGTKVGHTATWNTDIVYDDEETLYTLRRLQRWMGDVYVREPSGSGYWANVKVSFSQKHCDVKIPVTLNITRVEGGV